MKYPVRDENNIMKARISERQLLAMINTCPGEYITKNFKSGAVRCYRLTDDRVLTINNEFNLILWAGDYVEIK